MDKKDRLEYYFASTGFYDFLPMARDLIATMGFTQESCLQGVRQGSNISRQLKTGRPGLWLRSRKSCMNHGLILWLTGR